MQINSYLSFSGNCEEAFKLYERVFGGKTGFFRYGGSPMADQAPPGWEDKIMHCTLTLGDQCLQGADVAPDHYKTPEGITIAISVTDLAEAERIFQGLSENAKIMMPLQETFWALRFGMLVDQFGIPWMVNCENAS